MELLNVGLDNTHNLFWPDLHKHFFWQKSILLVVQLGKRAVENVTNKYSKAFCQTFCYNWSFSWIAGLSWILMEINIKDILFAFCYTLKTN